jgi:hypothetical protein
MKSQKLPPQLLSLIHHIALNESGWWEETIQRFIVSILWLKDNILDIKEIRKELQIEFNLNLEFGVIQSELDKLSGKNTIIRVDKNSFKLSEEYLGKFEKDLKEFEDKEQKAKDGFYSLMDEHCPSLDKDECWDSFQDELLIPLVHELGAKTYELISGQSANIDQSVKFQNYLNNYYPKHKDEIREVVTSFFDPKIKVFRKFILRKINAYFCLEAGNLSSNSLKKLTKLTKKNINFTLFIDTNFLFSILSLHDNPANEAAVSLKNLIDKIGNKINAKLYILPPTVKEASNVLSYQVEKLNRIRFTENVINGSKDSNLSGFAKKFIEDAKKSKKNISPKQYFDPYLNSLVASVRSRGVELYNKNLDSYSTDEGVIDDLNDRLNYEEARYGQNAKSYEQLLHDLTLWHFCKDQRPEIVESPIDANYWIVTVDFRFLGFDKYKRKKAGEDLNQICIHPASLIQMLQFWEPRSEEFEEAIINNIRTPFLLNNFNIESEKVTLKILETISRFEDLEDLPEETISSILVNKALRNKVGSVESIEEQVDLVKNAIIEQNRLAQEEAKTEKKKAQKLQNEVESKDSKIQNLESEVSKLQEVRQEEEKKSRSFESRIEELEKNRKFKSDLRSHNDRLGDYVQEKWEEYQKGKSILWIFVVVFLVGVLGIVVLFLNYPDSNEIKLISSLGFFFLTLILSFFNREKLKKSFKLSFQKKKTESNQKNKFKKQFKRENEPPIIEDY